MHRYNSTGIDPWEGGGASQGPGSAHRMTVDQIRTEQQQLINEQDKGLDELSKALRRQQQMGLDMQDEIKEHNGKIQRYLTLSGTGSSMQKVCELAYMLCYDIV